MEGDKTFQERSMKNVCKGLREPFFECIEISHHERAIFIYIKPQTIHKIDPLLLSIASLMAITQNGIQKMAEAMVKQEHCTTNYKVSGAASIRTFC